MQDHLSPLSLYNVAALERLFRRIDVFNAVNRLMAAHFCITAATVEHRATRLSLPNPLNWTGALIEAERGSRVQALGDLWPVRSLLGR